MNATTVPRKVWIVQRGNGKLEVTPSPQQLAPEFTIRNLTRDKVQVVFDAKYVDPPTATIDPGAQAGFRTAPLGPAFFEYDVTSPSRGLYVEGGSKPGGIIDP